ncbi:MAG: response regulator [Chloroflexi bacterium]|nr:response regulator [Chloroflexota bacterium]
MPPASAITMAKLMIVDDNHTMISLLATLLELDGFEVFPTTQPGDLVQNLREDQPDLVIMDVFLKNSDGIELLRKVRSTSEFKHLPVIMTSGMDVADQCLEAGANAFILKPYSPPDLIDMIRENLS